jgi:glycosyltransferase involved in cell wall biosynthesis
VVSTRCGGAVELIQDGVTGWLAEVGDEAGFENRLASLIADAGLRRQMGLAGRERMAAEFSIARMIELMTAIYSGLIARRDGRV